MNEIPNPAYILTLVHGTFAQNAKWISKESDFTKKLVDNLSGTSVIYPFNWSGKNSHSARLHAGSELAEHLTNLNRLYPDSKQIVVAHSHGGNVAMYAVKEIGDLPFDLKVVTMATPFLDVSLRSIGPVFRVLPFSATIFFIPLMFLLLVLLITLLYNYFFRSFPKHYSFTQLLLFSYCILALIMYVVGSASKKLFKYVKDLEGTAKVKGEQILSQIEIKSYPAVKLMAVTYVGDEARAWLSSSIYLNSMLFYLHYNLNKAAAFFVKNASTIFTFWVISMFFLAVADDVLNTQYVFIQISLFPIQIVFRIFTTIITLIPIMFLASLFLKSNPLVFGWESFYHILLVKTQVSTSPKHMSNVDRRIYESKNSRLQNLAIRHSMIYSDEIVIKDIAGWVKSDN